MTIVSRLLATARRARLRMESAVHLQTTRTADRLTAYRNEPALLMLDCGLTPDPWQESFLRSNDLRSMLCCARQVGKSVAVSIKILLCLLTNPGSTVLIVGPTQEPANELLLKVATAYNRIGRPVGTVGDAVESLKLSNGSRVLALPGKELRMRGYTPALIVFEEAARIPDDVILAASPTLAVSRGKRIDLSTAFSKSGWFYDDWTDKEVPAARYSITADKCPRYTEKFLENERRTMGRRWYSMEYENVFQDDVMSVFSTEDIKAAMDEKVKPLFSTSA